ncbi:MAG: hypothetical protein DCC67_06375 [Planctomycetota bacterium]|nr:MAG: hypothetical protein DCC67_06375 [Planctomycetota bacterium]
MRNWPLLAALAAALPTFWACQALGPRPAPETARREKDSAAYLAHPLAVGQLVFHADFLLPENHRLLGELVAEREAIVARLRLPPSATPIHVHLFADEMAYRRHVSREYPGFPERRAIFVESEGRLAIYAHWNDAIAEDLRHEVAHGYLHASVPSIPLWLDEGLAEYFEVSRGRNGVHRTHVDHLASQLAAGGWRPDLRRLEQLATAEQMTQLDYAEAWLWVHFALHSTEGAAGALIDYLAALRLPNGTAAAPLSQRVDQLLSEPRAGVVAHLRTLSQ